MAAPLLADLRDLRAATSTPDDTTAWLRALGFFGAAYAMRLRPVGFKNYC